MIFIFFFFSLNNRKWTAVIPIMVASLHSRLASVEASIERVSALIRRLHSFGSADIYDDDERINLSTEIHQDLGEIEEGIEVLRVETHPLDRRRHQRRESVPFDADAVKNVALMAKIEEDLKMYKLFFWRQLMVSWLILRL